MQTREKNMKQCNREKSVKSGFCPLLSSTLWCLKQHFYYGQDKKFVSTVLGLESTGSLCGVTLDRWEFLGLLLFSRISVTLSQSTLPFWGINLLR